MRTARAAAGRWCAAGMMAVAWAAAPGGATASAEPVVGWRTDGSGMYPEARPPITWSAERGVVWKTRLPDRANSSAVVAGGRVYVTSEPTTLICVDADTGETLWERSNTYEDLFAGGAAPQTPELAEVRRRIRELEANPSRATRRELARLRRQEARLTADDPFGLPRTHRTNGYASATPVSDGEHVWAVFGTGTVVCYDAEGRRVWARLLDKPTHNWGHSSSPRLTDGVLIVHLTDLVGLDAMTGEPRWRVPSAPNWGTPALADLDDETVVLTMDGQAVRARDGAVLGRGLGPSEWNGPYVVGQLVYFIERSARAHRLERVGDRVEAPTLWTAGIRGSRHYASPVLVDGLLYTISREETLSVIEAATGRLVYERNLPLDGPRPNSAYPSITYAGDLLFAGSESGVTIVFRPGRTYEQVARNQLEPYRSTPVFTGDRMYVRGLDYLYCIERDATASR